MALMWRARMWCVGRAIRSRLGRKQLNRRAYRTLTPRIRVSEERDLSLPALLSERKLTRALNACDRQIYPRRLSNRHRRSSVRVNRRGLRDRAVYIMYGRIRINDLLKTILYKMHVLEFVYYNIKFCGEE